MLSNEPRAPRATAVAVRQYRQAIFDEAQPQRLQRQAKFPKLRRAAAPRSHFAAKPPPLILGPKFLALTSLRRYRTGSLCNAPFPCHPDLDPRRFGRRHAEPRARAGAKPTEVADPAAQAATAAADQAVHAGRGQAAGGVRRRGLRRLPQAIVRCRREKGSRRARQAGGGPGFLLDPGQGHRRSEKARRRQSRQGDRSCRQGRFRLGHARRLWQRADRGRIARPQRRVLRAGRSDHRSSRPSKRSARRRRPIRPNGAIRSRTASKCTPRRSRIRRSSKSSA